MDESFLLRARRILDERRTPLDYGTLVKQVSARQAASPTVAAAALVSEFVANGDERDGVISILLVEPDWRSAARQQGGCFNRAAAKRHLNTL